MQQEIKYGQLWARHSELVEQRHLGTYRISFGGLKKAVEEAMRQSAVWVKASERLPLIDRNYYVKASTKWQGYNHADTALFRNGEWEFEGGRQLGRFVVEWLDESGQSKEGNSALRQLQNILLSDIDAPVFTHSPQFREHFDYIKKKFLEIIETRNEQPVEQNELNSDLETQAKEHAKTITNDPEYQLYVAQGYYNAKREQEENEAVDVDELWDEHSALIGDDLDDLSYWSGKEVMKKEDFKKAVEAFNQQKK